MPEAESAQSIDLTWPLIAMVLVLLANGFFVAVEFAIITARRSRLEQSASRGSKAAAIVLRMLKDPDRAIAAAQLGITSSSILLGIVAEEPLTELLAPILAPTLGRIMSDAAAAALAGLLVLLILSFFHMVWGEQTPKIFAIRNPERVAQFIAYPMDIFAKVTMPFVWIVDEVTALSLRLVGVNGTTGSHGSIASVEELKALVQQSGSVGILEQEAQDMLYRVFDFGERVVREVMVPRTNIIGFDIDQTVNDLMSIFRDHRYSRFPIYNDDLDHVVGVINMKRLVVEMVDKPEIRELRIGEIDLIQEPMMVPESRLISELFTEMRSSQTSLAIVIDEFGGTAGLVTVEELVEEVMGRITEEWSTSPLIRQVGEHAYELDAQLHVDEVNDLLGFTLEERDEYETIAGLILYNLRHIPKAGQDLSVPNYKIRVLELDGPKITKVRLDESRSASLGI